MCLCVWLMQWICDDRYIPYVFTSNYGKEIFLLCRHDPRRCRRPRFQSRMLPQCFIDMWMHENKNRNMELPLNFRQSVALCAASTKAMSSMHKSRNCNFIFLNSYTMPDTNGGKNDVYVTKNNDEYTTRLERKRRGERKRARESVNGHKRK